MYDTDTVAFAFYFNVLISDIGPELLNFEFNQNHKYRFH